MGVGGITALKPTATAPSFESLQQIHACRFPRRGSALDIRQQDTRMTSTLPSRSLPKLCCDLNACGWSGETGDDCYYSFDRERMAMLQPKAGLRVFIWDWSDDKLVIGCEAIFEPFKDSWRARPVADTWYEGLPDDTFA